MTKLKDFIVLKRFYLKVYRSNALKVKERADHKALKFVSAENS